MSGPVHTVVTGEVHVEDDGMQWEFAMSDAIAKIDQHDFTAGTGRDVPIAAIAPIDTARKPRSAKRLAADIHNAGLVVRFAYGQTPTSRHYAELVEHGNVIARDPMPTIMVANADRVLVSVPVEVPGPNCLDKMNEVLALTDAERVAFRTRREDVDALVAEAAAEVRGRLETP